jgi:hypothetical protein
LARPDPTAEPCRHLSDAVNGSQPLSIAYVMDDAGGMTDAAMRCSECGQPYLVELLDWSGPARTHRRYRVSTLAPALLDKFLHNLARGSCDLKRAGNERQSLEQRARLSRLVVTLHSNDLKLLEKEWLAPEADVPMSSWRERL